MHGYTLSSIFLFVTCAREWDNPLVIQQNNKRVQIHFGGVQFAFYLWANGNKAGYGQGSRTPAEFDTIPDIRMGKESQMNAEVYRRSDGAYLKDQDFAIAGIYSSGIDNTRVDSGKLQANGNRSDVRWLKVTDEGAKSAHRNYLNSVPYNMINTRCQR